jgi:hypothetical protein
MKTTLLCFLMLIAGFSRGQEIAEGQPAPDLESALTFAQEEFNGRFAVMAVSEGDYDYYVTDLTRLEDRFRKVYFLNLTYNDHRLVNIVPDISQPQIWFKVHYQYKEADITCLLDDLMKDAVTTGQNWTDAEKDHWLAKYDKFKILTNDGK